MITSGCHWSYSTSAPPAEPEHWSSTTSGTQKCSPVPLARGNHRRTTCGRRQLADREGAAMTTEETRAELLDALAKLGREHPNWRPGQTLSEPAMGRRTPGCRRGSGPRGSRGLAAARQLPDAQPNATASPPEGPERDTPIGRALAGSSTSARIFRFWRTGRVRPVAPRNARSPVPPAAARGAAHHPHHRRRGLNDGRPHRVAGRCRRSLRCRARSMGRDDRFGGVGAPGRARPVLPRPNQSTGRVRPVAPRNAHQCHPPRGSPSRSSLRVGPGRRRIGWRCNGCSGFPAFLGHP